MLRCCDVVDGDDVGRITGETCGLVHLAENVVTLLVFAVTDPALA